MASTRPPERVWLPAGTTIQPVGSKKPRIPPRTRPPLALTFGSIGLVCADPESEWTALMGETPPVISDGYGGWSAVQRPRRTAVTHWDGANPFKLTASFVLDGWSSRTFVERDMRLLENMAVCGDGQDQPPPVRFFGPVHQVYLEMVWVIDDIEWETDPTKVIVSSATGKHYRNAGTLHLLQYVSDELLAPKSAAEAHRKKIKKTAHNVRAKHGDTLEKIAKRNHCSVADLRALNPKIHNPGKALKAGTVVKVP